MKVPIRISAEREVDLRDPWNVNTLRLTYDCWRRREKGEEISSTEDLFAKQFEELLHEANLAGPTRALAFSKQLVKTLTPRKLRLIDQIVELAEYYETEEEVRVAVERKYGKRGDRTWQEAWQVFFRAP